MAPVTAPKNTIAEIASADGQRVYYLCQEEEELYEEKHDGDFGAPLDVGVAKSGTNAGYLLLENEKRTIYCLGEYNTVKDFEFDPEEWEWTEGSLGELAIEASPATEIAAISNDGTHREIFFQGPSGNIQSVYAKGGQTWELSSYLPETNPMVGASLCFLKVGGKAHLFYSHQSCSIHALTLDGEAWKDELVAASASDSPVSGIYGKLHGSSYMLQFCDANAKVYLLSDGESIKIGEIVNGRFKIDKDAQGDRWPTEIKSDPILKGTKDE